MSVIAFIPARGGSKSIPLKNIKAFCGKPLVFWTAKAANDASCVDKIIVASDSKIILDAAASFNLPKISLYQRDPANAQDNSSTESSMLEYIRKAELKSDDVFILIQATSPLTTSQDIDRAFELYKEKKADSLLTCSRTKRFFWNENSTPANYDFMHRPRRQDFHGTLMENGAFYISSVKAILESKCRLSGKIAVYEMPDYCGVELDEPLDWLIAENLMRKFILKHSGLNIKLLAMDVDGVLTDGSMYYSENGDELKRFHTSDGKGLELIRNAGIKTAILTSENRTLNSRRAEKLKVDILRQGVSDKLSEAQKICSELGFDMNNLAYVGDDLNDIELLNNAGLAACPANAAEAVKNIPGIVRLERSGGAGAVREFCEYILCRM